MLKRVLTVVGLVCFMGLWSASFTMMQLDAAGIGSRVKKESAETKKTGPAETKDGVKFVYKGKAESVFVAGVFNDWSATKNAMKQVKQGIWEIVLPLDAGKYQYKFVVDGNWLTDSENPNITDDGLGGKNSSIEVKKGTTIKKIKGPQVLKTGVKFIFSAEAGQSSSIYLAGEFNSWSASQDALKKDASGNWTIVKKLAKGKHQYKFVVDGNWTTDHENPNTADDGFGGKNSVVEVK